MFVVFQISVITHFQNEFSRKKTLFYRMKNTILINTVFWIISHEKAVMFSDLFHRVFKVCTCIIWDKMHTCFHLILKTPNVKSYYFVGDQCSYVSLVSHTELFLSRKVFYVLKLLACVMRHAGCVTVFVHNQLKNWFISLVYCISNDDYESTLLILFFGFFFCFRKNVIIYLYIQFLAVDIDIINTAWNKHKKIN